MHDFSNNPEAQKFIDIIKNTKNSVFLTGNAGTGKSTLLKHLRDTVNKRFVVAAPTGVAALNARGVTLHSLFNIPIRPHMPLSGGDPTYLKNKQVLLMADVIIIDEISMVRADVLNYVDNTLRRLEKTSLPFGGKQMIFVGDVMQLPPVVNLNDPVEKMVMSKYETPFFFSAIAFSDPAFTCNMIELQKHYRQKDDKFLDILNGIRNNSITDEELDLLNSRVIQTSKIPDGVITLTARNETANQINQDRISKNKNKAYTFQAIVEGNFPITSALPTDEKLTLKIGEQVMCIRNTRRTVNGEIFEVHDFVKIDELYKVRGVIYDENIKPDNNDKVLVVRSASSGYLYAMGMETWEKIEYTVNGNEIGATVKGSFSQIPFKLAWACTIHKSQGLTMDSVVIDMEGGAFAHGQTYVALSRCSSLQGLYLKAPISKTDIIIDPRLKKLKTFFK